MTILEFSIIFNPFLPTTWHNNLLAPVGQTLDSAIQRINHYPADKAIVSRNTYPLDRNLSGGWRYLACVADALNLCTNGLDEYVGRLQRRLGAIQLLNNLGL